MTGTWEDFTSKYGFNDGAAIDGRDYEAREVLIQLINARQECRDAGITAVAFDRPGLHNPCLIEIRNADGVVDLPEAVSIDIDAMVVDAYETDIHDLGLL
jgi:hypothetical protein